MLLWQSAILGLVEGLTEFLPISSTFHLLFASKILGIPETEFVKFFSVFIQGAAVLSILILYFREWLQDQKLLKNVAISFVPTAIVGLVLHKVIKNVFFESPILMLIAFAVVGGVFIVLEMFIKKDKLKLEKPLTEITLLQAVLIGLCQALAVVPGVSRAGAVMVAMMLMGYRRDEAAKYSFTLALPTIVAAAVLDLVKSKDVLSAISVNDYFSLGIGCVVAFISALIITKWFIQFLRTNSLRGFGVYRIATAALLSLFGFWRF